jgi:hypothetical protein
MVNNDLYRPMKAVASRRCRSDWASACRLGSFSCTIACPHSRSALPSPDHESVALPPDRRATSLVAHVFEHIMAQCTGAADRFPQRRAVGYTAPAAGLLHSQCPAPLQAAAVNREEDRTGPVVELRNSAGSLEEGWLDGLIAWLGSASPYDDRQIRAALNDCMPEHSSP